MQRIQHRPSRDEVRRALRSAMAGVLDDLMREKRCTQINLAGVTGLSRTTIGSVLAGGGTKGTSARCDTVADMIWGMGVSVEDLTFQLMMKASSARSAGAPGGENDEFAIRLGEFALCVRLRRLDETKMPNKLDRTAPE